MRRANQLFVRAIRQSSTSNIQAAGGAPKDNYLRHLNQLPLPGKEIFTGSDAFIAPNATVVGSVFIQNNVSVWYGAVIRGDLASVRIGHNTSLQDRVVVNTVAHLDSGFPADVYIGENTNIGAGTIITSSTVGFGVNVGHGCIIQEGSVVEDGAVLASGSVLLPGTLVPAGQFWAGNPAQFIRNVTDHEADDLKELVTKNTALAELNGDEFLDFGHAYLSVEK